MKPSVHGLVTIAATLILSACAETSSTSVKHIAGTLPQGDSSTTQTDTTITTDFAFKYDFDVNGCKTGLQRFDTVEKLCTGLQDEDLNNSCAQADRKQLFQQNCGDKDFVTFTTRALTIGQNTIVLHKNAEQESVKTTVFCTAKDNNKELTAENSTHNRQATKEEDGIFITTSENGILKFINDENAIAADGSKVTGTEILVTCEEVK